MSKNKIIKSTLLNIDSSYRTLYAKNICSSNSKILPLNPLTLSNNIVTVNYPNHPFVIGDNIVIQNVEGESKNLIDSFYLVNNFKYVIIVYNTNNIHINYKDYIDALYINIQIIGTQSSDNIINNIYFNNMVGIKQCLLANDIPQSSLNNIKTFSMDKFNSFDLDVLNKACLFVELPNIHVDNINNYIKIDQIFKISYLHIGGINLGYLNSNYPINNDNYQSSQTITNIIDDNTFDIQLKNSAYGLNYYGGGKNVQIMKIIDSITGYPNSNYYVIDLEKNFNNVTNIQLISTEFPYIDIVIKKNINDKLYWNNIEDGSHVYNIVMDEGFYTSNTFIDKLTDKLNNTPRYNYDIYNQNYNNFEIIIEPNIHKITFLPYDLFNGQNCIFGRQEIIKSNIYYILTIKTTNYSLQINDIVTISGSSDITINNTELSNSYLLINSLNINKSFPIYSINSNNSYDILLPKNIETTLVSSESRGGFNIIIKTATKIKMLFNYSDTIGHILGFKDIGFNYSIIDYSTEITNQDIYINSNNLDSVGNIVTYSSGFLNFVRVNNYFLMYLNDIDYVQMPNRIPAAFAKILLNQDSENSLFNTFVSTPINTYSKHFPISELSHLTIRFTYPDGSNVDFRNINHSFTLEISEEEYVNDE